MPKSPIVGSFSVTRSSQAADNRSVNVALEAVETSDGTVPGYLFLTSGLDLIGTLGNGPIRGVLPLNDLLYVVSGTQVYSLTPTGVATLLGTMGDQKTPVSMFKNNRQLMIVDGVGAWLVPGGLPLTSGAIGNGGGLYQVNDEITLQAATGKQTVYPILRVTGVSNNPVSQYILGNAGTAYNSATNVATTNIQPQAGGGTGFTVNITSVGGNGAITGSTLNAGGSGYAVNDTGTISGGSGNAFYQVTAVAAGAVTAYRLLLTGSGYVTGTGIATQLGPAVTTNIGVGFTVNITASGGPITASSVANGGNGYAIGNTGLITGGSADATYYVTAIGANGTVTSFVITQGGAIDSPAAVLTQKSTTGAGSNFTLTSPTFGSYVGLVPITVPFPNPLVGDVSDGFGLLIFLGSQNIAQSDELDLSTWDPLNFGVANQSPDNCLSIKVVHNEAYVFKENNTEVWVDEGNPNFAFGPLVSVHMENGIMAPFSVAVADEEVIWLSRNSQGQGIVLAANGYQTRPISTQALVNEFLSYPNLGDAIAYTRQEGEHIYYVLTFPEANHTWVYDKTSSGLLRSPQWHELAAFDDGALNRHWGNAFTPWTGSVQLIRTPSTFQAQAVAFTTAILQTPADLVGLSSGFSTAVFSVWVEIPDGVGTGIIFGNQGAAATPGLQVTIQNDATGTPQITVEAWDASANPIVLATYDFTTWATWTNILISIDTATQQLQVYANTVVGSALVENELTPVAITWSSSNQIAPGATQPWTLEAVA